MTETVLGLLRERAERIREDATKLLSEFSGIRPVNTPGSGMVFMSAEGNQFWTPLPPEGKQIQAQLLPEIDRLSELVKALTVNLPGGVQKKLGQKLNKVRRSVEQDGTTWWKSPNEAVEGFGSLIDEILGTLENYYDDFSGEVLAIADTNALIHNPDLEGWRFESVEQFTIVLTPTVLSELDAHKVNHRNQDVRERAASIIRRIKEYRRRGPLHDDVGVVKGKVAIRSIAREPNMDQSLSWFDRSNADDRFLASAIEVMRADLGKRAFIVTADINLQNKAEFAGVPFREPPPKRGEQEYAADGG